jgi:hypothetical protein
VTATGPGGTDTVVVNITINALPVITSQPADASIAVGGNVRFGIKATGTAPLAYKWIRQQGATTDTLTNSGIFTGTTMDTLRLTTVTVADTGRFNCRVTNVAGAAVSNTARVAVTTGIFGPYVVHVKGLSPFSFRIPEGNVITSVRMTVEDMQSRMVWSKDFEVNKNRVVSWNGAGKDGKPVSSGMYIVRIRTEKE